MRTCDTCGVVHTPPGRGKKGPTIPCQNCSSLSSLTSVYRSVIVVESQGGKEGRAANQRNHPCRSLPLDRSRWKFRVVGRFLGRDCREGEGTWNEGRGRFGKWEEEPSKKVGDRAAVSGGPCGVALQAYVGCSDFRGAPSSPPGLC